MRTSLEGTEYNNCLKMEDASRNVAFGILAFFVLVGGTVALILTLMRSDQPCESLPPLPYPWPVPANFTWNDCTSSNNTDNGMLDLLH